MTDHVVVVSPPALVTVVAPVLDRVLVVGAQGPAGPPGSGVTLVAAEAIGGHRVVAATAAGAVHASSADPTHRGLVVGVTSAASAIGATVQPLNAGVIEFAGWSWTAGADLFLDVDGLLTQSVPIARPFLQRIATALSPTSIVVTMTDPITTP